MSRECVMCGKWLDVGEKHRNVGDCLKSIRRQLEDLNGLQRFLAWVKAGDPRRRR